jgi:threonine aldolase
MPVPDGGVRRHFASDNWAGAHPEVLAAVQAASAGHAPSYGDDDWTRRAEAGVRRLLGEGVAPYFVFGGTAANVLGLATRLRPWQAVLCADVAHLQVDECGALERFAGSKLLLVPTTDGRLRPDAVRERIVGLGVVHHAQPAALSLTQSTEYGTVYAPDEIAALAALARAHGLLLHMDGARLANAAASLGCGLRDLTFDAGVDILSFGGTKNGLLGAEAVAFRDAALAEGFGYVRKQGMGLASKQRFVSAQFAALLEGDLWRRSAAHANLMAGRLAAAVRDVPGVRITQPVQANAVFAVIPRAAVTPLQREAMFYVWNEATGEVRWMTSFDTTDADVDRFAAAIARIVPGAA